MDEEILIKNKANTTGTTEEEKEKDTSDHETKNPLEIQHIVDGIREGDVDSQIAVDTLLRNRLLTYIKKFGGEIANRAEDLTQETLLKVFMRIGTYDESQGLFTSWSLSIAHNLVLDELRKLRSRPDSAKKDIGEFEFVLHASDNVEDEALSRVSKAELMAVLEQIPMEQREVIKLAYFAQLAESEIAERLGEKLGTIKTRKRLGMIKLREILHRELAV